MASFLCHMQRRDIEIYIQAKLKRASGNFFFGNDIRSGIFFFNDIHIMRLFSMSHMRHDEAGWPCICDTCKGVTLKVKSYKSDIQSHVKV